MCKYFYKVQTVYDIITLMIVLMIVGLIATIAVVIYAFLNHNKEKVKKNSEMMHKVDEVNKKYNLFNCSKTYKYNEHFHDVRRYRNFNAAVYLAGILLSSDEFLSIIKKTNESKRLYEEYLCEYASIKSSATQDDADKCSFSLKRFKRYETSYYESNKKEKPRTRIKFVVSCDLKNTQREAKFKKVFSYEDALLIFNAYYKQALDIESEDVNRELYAERVRIERALLTDSLRYDILRRDGFRCQICGATAQDGAKLHVDHIIPVSKGGKTIPTNLRTLCDRCNLGKRDKIE